jgi:hypothetical protein
MKSVVNSVPGPNNPEPHTTKPDPLFFLLIFSSCETCTARFFWHSLAGGEQQQNQACIRPRSSFHDLADRHQSDTEGRSPGVVCDDLVGLFFHFSANSSIYQFKTTVLTRVFRHSSMTATTSPIFSVLETETTTYSAPVWLTAASI